MNELLKIKNSITIVNNYYLGYSIPQIGKEFDLLRFGDNYIINIEIKTESSIDKIFKQQQKNKYYLEFLNKEIYIYTYILNENKLYKLIRKDSNNEIKEATFNELCNKLLLQEVVTFNNIDDLFNAFLKTNGTTMYYFGGSIKDRYTFGKNELLCEKKFLEELLNKIDNYLKDNKYKLSSYNLRKEIKENIDIALKCIEDIETSQNKVE